MTADINKTFLNTGLPLFSKLPYKVADLSSETVAFGRKEIELAEHEMPGLVALREEYAGQQPSKVQDYGFSTYDHSNGCVD